MKRVTHYHEKIMEHYAAEATVADKITDEPNVKRFIETEMSHVLNSPALKVLSEKIALRYSVDVGVAKRLILKAFLDAAETTKGRV